MNIADSAHVPEWSSRVYLRDGSEVRYRFWAADDLAAESFIQSAWDNGFTCIDGCSFEPSEILDIHDPSQKP